MTEVFPYSNIIAGLFILIVGFVFHWLGQFTSIINWEFATGKGLQEIGLPREYKVYEHGIAVADSLIGWIYGFAAIGLFLKTSWGFKLALMAGAILVYHSFSYWFWTKNRRKEGHNLVSNKLRKGWFLANFITGILAILVGWNAG